VIDNELVGELGYRDHEDEVEEEFKPGCTALLHFVRRRSKSRRDKPAHAIFRPLPEADAHRGSG
jgi:hypothetical protein